MTIAQIIIMFISLSTILIIYSSTSIKITEGICYFEEKSDILNIWLSEFLSDKNVDNQENNRFFKDKKLDLIITHAPFLLLVCIMGLMAFIFILYFKSKQYKNVKKQLLGKLKEHNEIVTQKELTKLKLLTLRAQMNPHFIFNSLQTVQSNILSDNSQKASEYLVKFSKLIRYVMLSAESVMSKLSEEVEFIKMYLALEKSRYDDKFDYIVDFPSHIAEKDIIVPSMIIQPHVENAITHGLINKKTKGKVSVSFSLEHSQLIIIIDDNGIGREKAAENLKKNIIKSHNQIAQKNIYNRLVKLGKMKEEYYQINDKFDDQGNSIGTKVIIKIKLNCDVRKQILSEE